MVVVVVVIISALIVVAVVVFFPLDVFMGERRGPPKPIRPVKSVVRANDRNKWSGRHTEIINRSQDFLATVPDDVAPAQVGLVQLQLGESLVSVERPDEGVHVLTAGLSALAEEPGTAWLRWPGWAMVAAATRDPSAAVVADRLFREAGAPASPAGRFRGHRMLGNALRSCDLIGSACDELERARDECPFSDPQSLGRVNGSLGVLFQETGRFDEAERAFDLAANYLEYSGTDRHDVELASLDWVRGRPRSAAHRLAELTPALEGDLPWGTAQRALALYDLGMPVAARESLVVAGPPDLTARGHGDTVSVVWVAARQLWVRRWLDSGDVDLAVDRFEQLWNTSAPKEGYVRDYMRITRARVRSAVGDHVAADQEAAEARDGLLSRSALPYAAEALWVRGQVAALAGDNARSWEYLTGALKEYENMGHELAPDRIRAELTAISN